MRCDWQADIFPIANFTEADTHALGVAKTAHLLRMLDKAVKYAQEERLRSRRRQPAASALGARNVGLAACRPPPPAPSEAPSSFISVPVAPESTTSAIQTASLSQVSGDTTRNLNLTMLPLLLNQSDACFIDCGRQHSSCVRISAAK